MMRVLDTFHMKQRGLVACVETDGPCPIVGSKLRRLHDGRVYTVRGVERFLNKIGTVGDAGEKVGLLLTEVPSLKGGDELERVDTE